MDHLGVMDQQEIESVVRNVAAVKAASRDYIWPAALIGASAELEVLLAANGHLFKVAPSEPFAPVRYFPSWEEAERVADQTGGAVSVEKGTATIPVSDKALAQLAESAGLPLKYLRYLEDRGMSDLAGHNISELMKKKKGKMLLRTMTGEDGLKVRAVLSGSYRTIDNHDLFLASADAFRETKADLWKARTWGDGQGFEMFAVSPHIRGEVRLDRPFTTGSGWIARWQGQEGDTQNASVKITNSETGHGGLNVSMAIMTMVCVNFCIWGKALSQIHLGRPKEEDGLIMSEDRAESEAKTLWLKVRDAVRTAFDPEAFRKYIDTMNQMTQEEIPAEKSIERVTKVLQHFEVTEDRISGVISELFISRDLSRYGLMQSVTYQAHDLDKSGKSQDASQMEEVGTRIAQLKPNEFKELMMV